MQAAVLAPLLQRSQARARATVAVEQWRRPGFRRGPEPAIGLPSSNTGNRFMKLVLTACVALVLLAATPASSQVIDLSKVSCKEFIDSGKENIAFIMMWLDGYYTAQDDPGVINFDVMKTKGEKLGAFCAKNPATGLLTAAEPIMEQK